VKASLGKALIPAFSAALGFITNKVIPIFSSLASIIEKDGLSGVIEKVKEKLPEIKEAFIKYANAAWQWIQDAVPPAIKAFADAYYAYLQWLKNTGLPLIVNALSTASKALWEWIQKAAPPALKRLGELIGDLANWLLDEGLPMMVEKLIELGNALVAWIKPQIVPALKALGDLLLAILDWVVNEAVPKLGAQAVKLVDALLSWTAQLLPEAVKGLGGFVVDLVKKLPGLFVTLVAKLGSIGGELGGSLVDGLVEALKGLAKGGLNIGKDFANGIIGFINTQVIDKLNALLDFQIGLPFGKKFTVNPPDLPGIPELASGGIVTGPTVALIGESGAEAVIPLSRGAQYGVGTGGGGINITVNAGLGADGKNIGELIVREINKFARSGGTRLDSRIL
jgi:hypothetical protein